MQDRDPFEHIVNHIRGDKESIAACKVNGSHMLRLALAEYVSATAWGGVGGRVAKHTRGLADIFT